MEYFVLCVHLQFLNTAVCAYTHKAGKRTVRNTIQPWQCWGVRYSYVISHFKLWIIFNIAVKFRKCVGKEQEAGYVEGTSSPPNRPNITMQSHLLHFQYISMCTVIKILLNIITTNAMWQRSWWCQPYYSLEYTWTLSMVGVEGGKHEILVAEHAVYTALCR